MNFKTAILNKKSDINQEMIIQIAKYSGSEIIIADENLNVIFQNTKYVEDKKILTVFDAIDSLLNEDVKTKIEDFRNSENSHLFMKLIISNNKPFENIPVDVHFCKIRNSKKKTEGYIVIIQDVVQEVRNRIQKETFIDIISHDLKNPMRANIRILELILGNKYGYINKELKNVLEELLNSCNFMKYMADNLIIKYRNEFDAKELNRRSYSVVKLVKEGCNKVAKILEKKKQSIELHIETNLPEVFVDTEEMLLVIKNLLINASNESRENSIIVIKIRNEGNKISVTLTDSGYTHKTAILDNLFDEYISCSNKFRKIGFSLEMFNCRNIIEAHGGTINAHNIGADSKIIIFTLPVYDALKC